MNHDRNTLNMELRQKRQILNEIDFGGLGPARFSKFSHPGKGQQNLKPNFIQVFLIWPQVFFTQEVVGVYTPLFFDKD